MYRLEYISTFYADISNIAEILSDYPEKAERIFLKLEKALKGLTNMPEMYPVYDHFPIFRKITIEDYVAFYIVHKHEGLVEVHRLLYEGMDIPAHLM